MYRIDDNNMTINQLLFIEARTDQVESEDCCLAFGGDEGRKIFVWLEKT